MKQILLTIVAAMAIQAGHACDICGMGTSNNNPFLFPHLHKRYIGINYLYRSFRITGDDGITSKEQYHTMLLTGQFSVGKKIQVYISVPLQSNSKEDYFQKEWLNGLGDASINLSYKLFDKTVANNRHIVFIGGGIKIPTGKNTLIETNKLDEQNFQLGTGSVDYTINSSYTFTHKSWSFGANASYKYNTNNVRDFRFGDIISTSITAAYKYDVKRFSLSPYLQLRNEVQLLNADQHVLQSNTGGNALYSTLGTDVSFKKISWGFAVQIAPIQRLADNQVKVDPAFSTRVSFTF